MRRYYASVEQELARVDALWEDRLYDEGNAILESILMREPGYGKAHAYMGWYTYTQANDYEAAARSYELALKFNPGFGGIYGNYTRVLMELGRYDEAIDVAKRGLRVGGVENSYLMAEIGRILERAGRLAESRVAYRDAYYLAEEEAVMMAMKAALTRVRRKRINRMVGIF